MRPKLLNESMIRIIKKRKINKINKKNKKINTTKDIEKYYNGDFYGVLVICIAVISFYLRYIIYNFN